MDYYQILGVSKQSSHDEIKKAYRKLAMQHHPDRPDGDHTKFAEINTAYDTLSNDDKRKQYDHQTLWENAQQQEAGDPASPFNSHSPFFEDIGGIFRDRRVQRNPDGIADITITLNQAYTGTDLNVNVGYANEVINIPPGTRDGAKIRLKAKGPSRIRNLPPGDLIVRISVSMPDNIARDGDDLYVRIEVNAIKAMIGTSIEMQHINGKILSIKVPSGVQHGSKLRVANWGMPNPQSMQLGHLYALVKINIPKVTEQQHIDMLNIINEEVNK